MVNSASISLKVIFGVHLTLTTWAGTMCQVNFMPASYLYMNAFVLLFGLFAIVNPEGSESLFMFFVTNLCAVLTDIIYLGIFTQGVKKSTEAHGIYFSLYQFTLAMAIINLLLRPFSSFVLYRIYQDRSGQYSDFGIPGLPGFGNVGGSPHSSAGGYESIDQPVPSNNIETASPHSTIDKSPLP